MKRLVLLVVSAGTLLCAADVSGVRTVYILPMSRGLDQHLANRLTNDHVFQVVTEAKQADAVFTDRIGEAFEMQMESLYPRSEAQKPAQPPPKDKKEEADIPGLVGESANKLSNPALNSAFSRGRGTVFLVDVKSRQVLWSAYEAPKGMWSDLDKTAGEIVGKLKKDLGGGSKRD